MENHGDDYYDDSITPVTIAILDNNVPKMLELMRANPDQVREPLDIFNAACMFDAFDVVQWAIDDLANAGTPLTEQQISYGLYLAEDYSAEHVVNYLGLGRNRIAMAA